MPPRTTLRKRPVVVNDSDEEPTAPSAPKTAQASRTNGKAPMGVGGGSVQAAEQQQRTVGNMDKRTDATPMDDSTNDATKKKPKKKKMRIDDLFGFDDLADGGNGQASANTTIRKRDKPVVAIIKLGTHQTGDKKGQFTGRAFYAMNCDYGDNTAFVEIVESVLRVRPQWFKDWAMWGVRCPTAELALKVHETIKQSDKLKVTARRMNQELDVTPYQHKSVATYNFTLATSETQFETRADGVLPRSVMIIGKGTYDFKGFIKEQFPTIRYLDLIFNGGKVVKAAWVLADEDQTSETGTLAEFLESLGASVAEMDLDDEDDEDDDAERDADAFVDAEAAEGEEDDSQ